MGRSEISRVDEQAFNRKTVKLEVDIACKQTVPLLH
jgi:hypothetical protein